MNKIIDNNSIFIDKSFTNKWKLLEDIAECAGQLNSIAGKDVVLSELIEREETLSTSVGKGIAIPHCKSNSVKESKVFLYRLDEELQWDETEKVSLVFAILTNEKSSEHLAILAKLSRNLLKKSFLEAIYNAKESLEILDLINQILNKEEVK